jgi:hypothetical protein
MTKRPLKNNWDDVKMVITTIAITSTLGFWNLFSRLESREAATVIKKVDPPQPTATQAIQNTVPVKPANAGIIYFQPNQPVLTTLSTPQAGQKPAKDPSAKVQNKPAKPDPVTNTSSSR